MASEPKHILLAYRFTTIPTWEILVLLLQDLHSNVLFRKLAMQIRPQRLQT